MAPNMTFPEGAACFLNPSKIGKSSRHRCSTPCEVLAISRWAGHGWHSRTSPVPLRSAFAVWGRHDLTPEEQRQVRTANVLFVYAIVFATLSAVFGIANLTEHPYFLTRHAGLTACSIWLTEQTRRLQVLPNVHSHRFQHCTYGGIKTRKPTRCSMVNMKQSSWNHF